jgi:hypothetical protein
VQKRILSIVVIAFLFVSIIFAGCSKFDTTDIGSDLLPAVDNVSTFEEILPIITTQGIFNPDTTRVGSTDDNVLGRITSDPLFGTTQASVYAQFKPTFYPFHYNIPKDSLVAFDSVVLCLSYKGNWGDSMVPLELQVKEVLPNTGGLWDSIYIKKDINYAPALGSTIGTATINISGLKNFIVYANRKDSVKNQIRIKLSTAFAASLFTRDSSETGANNSFRSDALFRAFNNGIAISANGSGNALLYTNFSDPNTRLEVHFRRKNGAVIDTTFTSLKVAIGNAGVSPSSTANNIIRNRPAFTSPDEIYLQTTPGTYANLSIPQLSTLSNRIIHRAEIIVEQIPDIINSPFAAPDFLYIDLKDTSTNSAINKWKPVYFDLNPGVGYDPDFKLGAFFPTGGIDFRYYGGFVNNKTDQFGNAIKYYNFNITRYVQRIVTNRTPNYILRLFAPYEFTYPQYSSNYIPFGNRLAEGRIKVGSGSNPNYKMRLRLVYSKI